MLSQCNCFPHFTNLWLYEFTASTYFKYNLIDNALSIFGGIGFVIEMLSFKLNEQVCCTK